MRIHIMVGQCRRRSLACTRSKKSTHLSSYGVWANPENVVLGHTSYQSLANHEHAQFVQQVLAATKSFLFIGCGSGMEDPNLGILIDWIRTRYPNSLHRHYRLCLDKDVCALQTNRSPNDRVYPIVYGNKYSQLTQFIKEHLFHWHYIVPHDLIQMAAAYEGQVSEVFSAPDRWKKKDEILSKWSAFSLKQMSHSRLWKTLEERD